MLNILERSCFWGEWVLQTQDESVQGVMCWWCPELCWAPKQQGGNWLLLSNSPEARQRGELQPGTLEQCHENWNSFSFFLLIWVYYPLLWVSAGGQCYLKTWLSSKALTRMLHTRNTDRKIAISPLVHWTGLPLLNTKGTIFSFCMQSCL